MTITAEQVADATDLHVRYGLTPLQALEQAGVDELPWRKEQRPCCNARRDHLGRLPLGDCGPDCLAKVDRAMRDSRPIRPGVHWAQRAAARPVRA